MLVDTGLKDFDALDLVRRLHEASPTSKLIVFDDRANFSLEMGLSRIETTSYLVWADVTPETIEATLQAVKAGLRVGSPLAVDEIAFPDDHLQELAATAKTLSDHEWAVLRALAGNMEEDEVVEATSLSRSTVSRAIADLKRKFGVRTLFMLGMVAVVLGILPDGTEKDW